MMHFPSEIQVEIKSPYRASTGPDGKAINSKAKMLLLASFLLDVGDNVTDGLEFFGVGLGNLAFDLVLEFLFERHDELDDVERISAKIVQERCLGRNLFLVNIQLVNDDFLNALIDGFLVGHEIKN
jgi:hypothetical protein